MVTPVSHRSADTPLTLRERSLLEAADAAVSSWAMFRDDLFRSDNALRHEDGMVCAFERLDDALNPYHLPTDGGE